MARSRQSSCLSLTVASMVFAAGLGTPDQTPADDGSSTAWPCQLIVAEDLRAFADLAWDRSATFRDQCRKLAAARAVVIVDSASSREMWRAETRIRVSRDGVTFARVRVRRSRKSVELIAHELEHVLERVDGVNFLMEASRGSSRVSLSGGAFETQRAIDAGRRVAQEVHDATNARK